MQPGMQRHIEVLPGARSPDRGTLQDEQRDRQQRDRGHFLVDIFGHGIERGMRHINAHEHHRDRAQREGDRHARKHRKQGSEAVTDSNPQYAHRRAAPLEGVMSWSNSCTQSSVMPMAIRL
jgi:hypothetical protein